MKRQTLRLFLRLPFWFVRQQMFHEPSRRDDLGITPRALKMLEVASEPVAASDVFPKQLERKKELPTCQQRGNLLDPR